MAGRISRWYAGVAVAGVLYLIGWVFVAGYGGAVIQVEWGYVPKLEGAEVVIDGEVAGTLFRRGRQTLSGFRVPLGRHEVRVRLEEYDAVPYFVEADVRGAQYPIYAWTESRWQPDGSRRRQVRLGKNVPD